MTEDNLYNYDGSFINREPLDQVREKTKEKKEVLKEYPKIAKAIEILERSIAHHKSIDAISSEVVANPDEFMHVVAGNKAAVAVLEGVKGELEGLLDTVR